MTLFTPIERESIKNDLVNLLNTIPEVSAAILIGSATTGYTDELSDIDIMLIVNNENKIVAVMDSVCAGIKAKYNVLCFAQLNERKLQICLLDNFLELNFSYRTIETLEARAAAWQIIFDKTGIADSIMFSTHKKFEETTCKNIKNAYQSKLAEYSEQIWHFIFHATAAINRGRFWKAVSELEYARNIIIELKGLRYSLSMHRNGEVDKIPNDELALLEKTLPFILTKEALKDNLNHLIIAAYNELEVNSPNPYITISRQQAVEYVTQALSLEKCKPN